MKQLIPNYLPFIPKESIDNAVATLKTSWIGGDGPQVKKFETEIAKIIGNKNTVALNSGTSALEIALRICDVKGYEVITSPMTCFATNAAIVNEGGIPVWTDIDPYSGNINPDEIVKNITKRTRAIMVVHWGGSPAQMDVINKIASTYKLKVIEDAAQALGSTYQNKPIGTHSDFVVFSMQAIKIINTVDGGILATKRKSDAKRAKILRWYGIDREERKYDINGFAFWKYPIKEVGYKAQMTDVSAAIGLGQITYLKDHLDHRRKLAELYTQALKDSKNIKPQKILPYSKPNYWIYTVLCKNQEIKNELSKKMNKISVKVEEAHRRNDLYPVFRKYYHKNLPEVTFFDKNHLVIPVGHWVNDNQAKKIAQVLSEF